MATLSSKFDNAFHFAAEVHRQQTRKDTEVPYLTHLMSVAALIGEHGGDEEQMIAGLLHDAMEDQGITRQAIEQRFGKRVADIVEACTDSTEQPKPPWRERKAQYIEHLRTTNPDIKLVSAADKLHNARSILTDLRIQGPALWARFTVGSAEGVLWYFHGLVQAFREGWSHPLIDALEQTVGQIEELNKTLKNQCEEFETTTARSVTYPIEQLRDLLGNKLTLPLTVLGHLRDGKRVNRRTIERAIRELETIAAQFEMSPKQPEKSSQCG